MISYRVYGVGLNATRLQAVSAADLLPTSECKGTATSVGGQYHKRGKLDTMSVVWGKKTAGRAHWNSAGNTIYINKVYGYYSVALGPSPMGTH